MRRWFKKGATEEEISNDYTDMVNLYNSEPVSGYIRVGNTVLILKDSSSYFISIIMSYFVGKVRVSLEESFSCAIGTYALVHGPKETRLNASKTLHDSIDFHHNHKRKDKADAEKELLKYKAIVDDYFQVEAVKTSNYSEESIKDFKDFILSLILDKPERVTKLCYKKVEMSIKTAEFYFMAIIMAYLINHEEKSRDEAFETSLVWSTMLQDGVEVNRSTAGKLFKLSMEWHLNEREKNLIKADGDYLENWEYINSQFELEN